MSLNFRMIWSVLLFGPYSLYIILHPVHYSSRADLNPWSLSIRCRGILILLQYAIKLAIGCLGFKCVLQQTNCCITHSALHANGFSRKIPTEYCSPLRKAPKVGTGKFFTMYSVTSDECGTV